MEEMLNNFEMAKKMAKNAYNLVNSKYTLDRIAIQIDNAITKIKNGEIKWNYQKQKVKLPLTKN